MARVPGTGESNAGSAGRNDCRRYIRPPEVGDRPHIRNGGILTVSQSRAHYPTAIGTAGCVIASRLTENDSIRVLLLEAGPAQPLDAMAVPPAWPTLFASPANWGDITVKQAATGTSTPLARGRALGGSSAINAMGFVRGHRSSYDAWVSAGAEGWGFDDLLPRLVTISD